MVNLAQAWAEEYATIQPPVSVEVAGGGSATGIASLIDGGADLANCSRKMEPGEIEAAKRKRGRIPGEWIVGHDALAVYVHPGNPLESISLEQLAEIYGRNGRITHWSQLGVIIPGIKNDEIILISRQSNSGTYTYFRETILGQRGDFRLGTLDLNGSREVVSLIGRARTAIGYSGMGYATSEVRMLSVSRRTGEQAYAPSQANALSGAYPISRPLYIYSLGEPTGPTGAYLDWIRSPQGQKVVEQAGYVAITPAESAKEPENNSR